MCLLPFPDSARIVKAVHALDSLSTKYDISHDLIKFIAIIAQSCKNSRIIAVRDNMLILLPDHALMAAIVTLIESALIPRLSPKANSEFAKSFLEAAEIFLPVVLTTPKMALNVIKVGFDCQEY